MQFRKKKIVYTSFLDTTNILDNDLKYWKADFFWVFDYFAYAYYINKYIYYYISHCCIDSTVCSDKKFNTANFNQRKRRNNSFSSYFLV